MKHVLTMTGESWHQLQAGLTQQQQGVEYLYLGLLTLNQSADRREFWLKDAWSPDPEDYLEQHSGGIQVKAELMAQLLLKSKPYAGLLVAHNHLGSATPSDLDEQQLRKLMGNIEDFQRGNYVLQLIWGQDGIFCQIKNAQMGTWRPVDCIKVIADDTMVLHYPINAEQPRQMDAERHNRTLNLLGQRGPEVLSMVRDLRWGFIGAGGTLSCFIYLIKFLGIQQAVIVEGDRIERSNANRLFGYRHGDEGRYKGQVMARELLSFDPAMTINVMPRFFPHPEAVQALKSCDILICGPDNDFCRYKAAEFASRYWKVLLELGSGIRLDKETGQPVAMGSQARLQFPTEQGRCLACLGLETDNLTNPKLEAEIRDSGLAVGYIQESDLPTPVSVVTLNSIIASVGIRMLLSYFTGIGSLPLYLVYDELQLQFRDVSAVFKKRAGCSLCGSGENALQGWGDNLPQELTLMEAPDPGPVNMAEHEVGGVQT